MLYCLKTSTSGSYLVNTTDLAIRCIQSKEEGRSYDVIVRTPDEDGGVCLCSLGSLRESDVKGAYGADFPPMARKFDKENQDCYMYAWADKLALRPTTLGRYDLLAESSSTLQAVVVIIGLDHHVELNRKLLHEGDGIRGNCSVLRMTYGDVACIDGNWLTFDNGLRRMSIPPSRSTKMLDYSDMFSACTAVECGVDFF